VDVPFEEAAGAAAGSSGEDSGDMSSDPDSSRSLPSVAELLAYFLEVRLITVGLSHHASLRLVMKSSSPFALSFPQVVVMPHDKCGAQELQRLRDRVVVSLDAEAPQAAAAQFDLLRELARYGGRRVRIVKGMAAMARAHAERDVRQLRKLEALIAAARRERLLPAGFDYRAAGEAWMRARAAGGGGGKDNRHQQQEHDEQQGNQQHETQHVQQQREQGEREGQRGPSASPETVPGGGRHSAAADVELVEGGDDTGIPTWRPLHGGGSGDADEDMVVEPQEKEQRAEGDKEEGSSGEGGDDDGGCTLQELLDDLEVLEEDGDEGDGDTSGQAQHGGDEEDEEEEEEFTI
jgi:hypothetical protein